MIHKIQALPIKLFCLVVLWFLLNAISYGLPEDKNAPYTISSDSIFYYYKQHLTLYVGHVLAVQGTTTVEGDHVEMYYDTNHHKIAKIVAYGKPAHYSTIPKQKQSQLKAQADTITYFPEKNQVLLVKHAKVQQDKNIFKGEHIWYDILNQTVISKGGKTDQTTLILDSGDGHKK